MRIAIIIALIASAIVFAFSRSDGLLPAIVLLVYFVPWLVGSNRHHRQKLAISMLNLFGGWTLIGWVVALVWACTSDVDEGSEIVLTQ
jgi:hypothetical protein